MIGAIENAICARLMAASAARVLGYSIKAAELLPVDVDERLIEHFKTYPSFGTVFGGWKPLGENRHVAKVELTIHLVAAAQNARNEKATRLGVANSAQEVGSYQLIEDAIALLLGQSLGLEMSPLMLGTCAPLYTGAKSQGQQISLMFASFSTQVAYSPTVFPASDLVDFKTFRADWDAPPFGDATPGQEDPADPLPPTVAANLDQA